MSRAGKGRLVPHEMRAGNATKVTIENNRLNQELKKLDREKRNSISMLSAHQAQLQKGLQKIMEGALKAAEKTTQPGGAAAAAGAAADRERGFMTSDVSRQPQQRAAPEPEHPSTTKLSVDAAAGQLQPEERRGSHRQMRRRSTMAERAARDAAAVSSTKSFQSKILGRRTSCSRTGVSAAASQQRQIASARLSKMAQSLTYNAIEDPQKSSKTGISFSGHEAGGESDSGLAHPSIVISQHSEDEVIAEGEGEAAAEGTGEGQAEAGAEEGTEDTAEGTGTEQAAEQANKDTKGDTGAEGTGEDVKQDAVEGTNTEEAKQDTTEGTSAEEAAEEVKYDAAEGTGVEGVDSAGGTAEGAAKGERVPPGDITGVHSVQPGMEMQRVPTVDTALQNGWQRPKPPAQRPSIVSQKSGVGNIKWATDTLRGTVGAEADTSRRPSQLPTLPDTISQEVYTRAVDKAYAAKCLKHSKFITDVEMNAFVLDHLLVEQQTDNFQKADQLVGSLLGSAAKGGAVV